MHTNHSECALLERDTPPFDERISDIILFSPNGRYFPALFFTIGKLFQAAGQNMLGINKTSEAYDLSKNLTLGLIVTLTAINVWITASTRATKIFEYFLIPKIYFTPNITDFENNENYNFLNSYILTYETSENPEKHLVCYCNYNNEHRHLVLAVKGEEKLNDLLKNHNFSNYFKNNLYKISSNFSEKDFRLFTRAVDHQIHSSTHWLWQVNSVYYAFYFMCSFSTIFSSMTAYLSSITLTNQINPSCSEAEKITLGGYVVICCTLAYLTFNLAVMQKSVANFCQSLNDGLTKGNFGIPAKAMSRTIIYSIPGVFAGAGMAYFTTTRSVYIFPIIKNAPEWVKTMIVFTNVVVSIFPSIFNFSSGCFNLLKKTYPEKTSSQMITAPPQSSTTLAERIAQALIFTDSVSNALGGFIGTKELLELMNKKHNFTISVILFIVSIIIAISNAFLNYGMSKNGSETMIHLMNSCCHPKTPSSVLNSSTLFSPIMHQEAKQIPAFTRSDTTTTGDVLDEAHLHYGSI